MGGVVPARGIIKKLTKYQSLTKSPLKNFITLEVR